MVFVVVNSKMLQSQCNGASFLCSDTQANSPKKDTPSPCYPVIRIH